MHGCSRLGSGRLSGSSSPSPPSSPRLRHGRGKGGGRGPKLQSFTERIVHLLLSAVFRRRGVLLFAPLVYISGMLIYMGTLSFDVPGSVVIRRRPTPGSTYRSPQVFEQLWPFLEVDGNSSDAVRMLAFWTYVVIVVEFDVESVQRVKFPFFLHIWCGRFVD